MLVFAIIPFKSSEVASGEGWPVCRETNPGADGVLRCFVKYDADRGRAGLELLLGEWWKDGLRLTSGEVGVDDGVDEAGDLLDGGV